MEEKERRTEKIT